jgi:ankyrin repeat protein
MLPKEILTQISDKLSKDEFITFNNIIENRTLDSPSFEHVLEHLISSKDSEIEDTVFYPSLVRRCKLRKADTSKEGMTAVLVDSIKSKENKRSFWLLKCYNFELNYTELFNSALDSENYGIISTIFKFRKIGQDDKVDSNVFWKAIQAVPEEKHQESDVAFDSLLSLLNRDKDEDRLIYGYAIHWAAAKNRTRAVKRLLEDPNFDPSSNGNIALRSAIRKGHEKIALLLLADKRVHTADLYKPFYETCASGLTRIFRILLPCVSVAGGKSQALRLALRNGNNHLIDSLIQHGCNPLHGIPTAIKCNNVQGLKQLLTRGGNDLLISQGVLDLDNYALAIQNDFVEMFEFLLSPVEAQSRLTKTLLENFLIQAIAWESVKVLKHLLVHYDISVTTNRNQAIRLACEKQNYEITNLLLYYGADPSVNANYCLRTAIENGILDIAGLLLKVFKRYDSVQNLDDCFLLAIERNCTDLVRKMLEMGFDPTEINDNPLRIPCEQGYEEIVKLLLSCDSIVVSAGRNEALVLASVNGHKKIVEMLLNDSRLDTLSLSSEFLRIVNMQKHVEIVKLLIDHGFPYAYH